MIRYIQMAGGPDIGKSFYHDKIVHCNICGKKDLMLFVDGKTKDGRCLNMCQKCDRKFGDNVGPTYARMAK